MSTSKKRSKSIFRYIVTLFIVSTCVIVALGFLIVALYSYRIESLNRRPKKEKMSIIAERLVDNDFDEEEIEDLLGIDAVLEVYNESLDLVYSYGYNEEEYVPISKGEMEVIPMYDEKSVVETETGFADDGKKITIIKTTNYINDEEVIISMVILDEKLNVVFSSYENSREKYTESEVEYLSQKTSPEYYIYKYPFINDNEAYTMIVKTPKHETVIDNLFLRSYLLDAIAFAVCYILVFLVFLGSIKRNFKKPILLINNGIDDLANGRTNRKIDYKGAAEFEQICTSFNNMAIKLETSENKRIEMEKEKEKFICNVSHDLKTPITVVHGYLKAISDGVIPPEKQEKYLQIMYNKSLDLVELINDFHDYNKFNHPDFELNYEKVDLSELSREYLVDKYDEIDVSGFELDVQIPDDAIYCNIDKLQLKRVFENIIGNAIKHNCPGTKISFNLNKEGSYAVIEIADTGKGINSEIIETIFEPFAAYDKKSGLGLYICKVITEAHGGSIKYKKDEKYATIFEISIPIIQ